MTTTTSLRNIIVLGVALFALVGYNYINAAWTKAPSSPPSNNVKAPVNVGSVPQTKNGSFATQHSLYASTSVQSDKYMVAQRYAATASVWSPKYCDRLGHNCFTPESGGGSATVGGTSLLGHIGTSKQYWPDVIRCGWGGSAGTMMKDSLLYASNGVSGTKVAYKYPVNHKADGNEAVIVFNKANGAYVNSQGVSGTGCTRNIYKYISDNDAYYFGSGWVHGNQTRYSWYTGNWSSCNYSLSKRTRTVTCKNDSTGATVADSKCTLSKPTTSEECHRSSTPHPQGMDR